MGQEQQPMGGQQYLTAAPGSVFTGTLLTGVFAGFAGTIICLAFNIIYRDETGYLPSMLINVSSLIFAVNILFVFIGLAYFVCLRYLPKGDIFFEVVFLLLTAFCLMEVAGVHRSDNAVVNHQFKGLLSGVIIILALCTMAMPLLYHNKGFREHVI
jgi:hypothetical protein